MSNRIRAGARIASSHFLFFGGCALHCHPSVQRWRYITAPCSRGRSGGTLTDMLPQQGNNDVVEHKLTRKLKDKIVAYMIVLALHVDGFSIEYEVIAKDLKYVAHELGGGGPPPIFPVDT